MTRAAKPASARAAPRRNASIAPHNAQHANRTPGNVLQLSSLPEPVHPLVDHGAVPVSQGTMTTELLHGLSETMIEQLLKRNDVVLLMECDQKVCRFSYCVPYRGKQRRGDILRFLRIAGPQVRALVYSHQAEEGPVWIDVMSGEVSGR